jgi:23S rRNA pseudouridine955/2504/2580 synthase/23S rRNA pseudouridine1911/1915/1917 synthase
MDERIITTLIKNEEAGVRLDHFLSQRFDYLSRNQWQCMIKTGKISLNNKSTKSSRILQKEDVITFKSDKKEPEVNKEIKIIYEDNDLIVVNKNGNLPVHPAGAFYQNTLWYLLKDEYPNISLISRLDRETSGLIILSKNKDSTAFLMKQQEQKKIIKEYYCIVYGEFKQKINAKGYLHHKTGSIVRKKKHFDFEPPENYTEKVETSHTILTPYKSSEFASIVKCKLLTGRMHQIRATLYSLGYPVIGDKLYGKNDNFFLRIANDSLTEKDFEELITPRQALHAFKTEFIHPKTLKTMTFNCDLPNELDFTSIVSKIKN